MGINENLHNKAHSVDNEAATHVVTLVEAVLPKLTEV